DHGPNQRAEEQRRVKYEMLAKKFERLERPETNVFAQTPSRAQMNECDPGMLRVPNDRWNGANCEKSKQPIQTRPFELLAQTRRKSENEEYADDFEGVRVATEKSKDNNQ